MNIQKIKEVVNDKLIVENAKRHLILQIIAEDKDAHKTLLEILDIQNKQKQELIEDLNLEVSRLHIFMLDPKLLKQSTKKFALQNVEDLYVKYKGIIKHCFNKFNN
jgi:ribosomal protein L18